MEKQKIKYLFIMEKQKIKYLLIGIAATMIILGSVCYMIILGSVGYVFAGIITGENTITVPVGKTAYYVAMDTTDALKLSNAICENEGYYTNINYKKIYPTCNSFAESQVTQILKTGIKIQLEYYNYEQYIQQYEKQEYTITG